MSEYEIYSYEAFRKKYEDDIRICEKAQMNAIDMDKLKGYLEKIKQRNPKLARLSDEDIYKFLNMIIDDKPTLVCVLLFSLYPQMFYPQYTVNVMVVMGYEKGDIASDSSRFIDNRRIEGTIDQILEETMRFLYKNTKIKTIIDPNTGKRKDKTEYPVIALREGVINALIHREYSINTQAMPIEIIMYKDRLEIIYGRLTIDKLGKVQPDSRNPVLARAMETLELAENRYSGIPTIIREMKSAGMKEPVFKNSRSEFSVIFYNADSSGLSREAPDDETGCAKVKASKIL